MAGRRAAQFVLKFSSRQAGKENVPANAAAEDEFDDMMDEEDLERELQPPVDV